MACADGKAGCVVCGVEQCGHVALALIFHEEIRKTPVEIPGLFTDYSEISAAGGCFTDGAGKAPFVTRRQFAELAGTMCQNRIHSHFEFS